MTLFKYLKMPKLKYFRKQLMLSQACTSAQTQQGSGCSHLQSMGVDVKTQTYI